MKVTKDVITDLLPLYFSGECSQDTKLLVEDYLEKNPEFKEQASYFEQNPFPKSIPQGLNKENELKSLVKTRRILKLRSYLMGFAIFFSLAPLSFVYINGKYYSLITESPTIAIIYGSIGLIFWITYFVIKRRASDL